MKTNEDFIGNILDESHRQFGRLGLPDLLLLRANIIREANVTGATHRLKMTLAQVQWQIMEKEKAEGTRK